SFWTAAGDIVRANDPHLQGIIVLGKEMPDEQLARVFALSRPEPLVRGFAIGRSIFNEAAKGWFAGTLDDAAAHDKMKAIYQGLIAAWDNAA
ncbi:MAG TPA: 5-dehydro-2-deoxygluconokinase, partial [Alphaproteobacteria bacterium]|nr:5-dehydro-2-deoxygluconokinase [Alphaproteobacteria bacterium]